MNNPIDTQSAHNSRSNRYSLVDSKNLIEAITANGYKLVDVQSQKVRNESRQGFQKHMMIFEAVNNMTPAPAGHKWQILVNNSHDGSCSVQFMAGAFRFVCANGLILGDFSKTARIRHVGITAGKVKEALTEVYATFETQKKTVEAMQAYIPNESELRQIAAEVAQERITKNPDGFDFKLTLDSVIAPQREEDNAKDLWTRFNVIQENVIRGGIKYKYKTQVAQEKFGMPKTKTTQHNRTTKEVKAFSQQQELNRMVFNKCFQLLKVA